MTHPVYARVLSLAVDLLSVLSSSHAIIVIVIVITTVVIALFMGSFMYISVAAAQSSTALVHTITFIDTRAAENLSRFRSFNRSTTSYSRYTCHNGGPATFSQVKITVDIIIVYGLLPQYLHVIHVYKLCVVVVDETNGSM